MEPVSNKLQLSRLKREAEWADAKAFEDVMLEPYLEHVKASERAWLELLQERARVVLETNCQLRNQLNEQELELLVLEDHRACKRHEWEALQVELGRYKADQTQAEVQIQELRESRLAEELQLRERAMGLRVQVAALLRENCRQELERKAEERRITRNRDFLKELAREAASLEKQKAGLEVWSGDTRPSSRALESPGLRSSSRRKTPSPPMP
mmetsp:Transcript_40890/g.89498  ORF Transcript_40890/g.89498 Transcript_40890/m.89498 type:complete len:212 (-) Transcript_40890:111-746(-)